MYIFASALFCGGLQGDHQAKFVDTYTNSGCRLLGCLRSCPANDTDYVPSPLPHPHHYLEAVSGLSA